MHHMKPNGPIWRRGRAKLDLSAEEAAVRLRIKPNYLRNIESNQKKATPSERLVCRAAALYGVTFDELVADDEQPKQPPEKPVKQERQPDPSGPGSRPGRDRKGPPRADLAAAS